MEVAIVSFGLSGSLATGTINGGGKSGDTDGGPVLLVVVIRVVRFGLSGSLGLGLSGESPDGVTDVAGGTAGVGSLGGLFLVSGPLSKTLQ